MSLSTLSEAELNALSPAEIEAFRLEKEEQAQAAAMGVGGPQAFFGRSGPAVIAMGDSWFAYGPAGADTLDFLDDRREYRLLKRAWPGDTLENMVLGTKYSGYYRRKETRLNDVLQEIEEEQANVLLVSGGGNDVAGPELQSLLNHHSLGLPALREEHLEYLVETTFRKTFQFIIDQVAAVRPETRIFAHGYGNAPPTGEGIGGWFVDFIGPWLKPAFVAKNITAYAEQKQIVETLIGRLNDLLADLDAKNPNFTHIDVRPLIGSDDWVNELHVNAAAYRRVANAFHDRFVDHVHGPGA